MESLVRSSFLRALGVFVRHFQLSRHAAGRVGIAVASRIQIHSSFFAAGNLFAVVCCCLPLFAVVCCCSLFTAVLLLAVEQQLLWARNPRPTLTSGTKVAAQRASGDDDDDGQEVRVCYLGNEPGRGHELTLFSGERFK